MLKLWIEPAAALHVSVSLSATGPAELVKKGPELTPAQKQDLSELEYQLWNVFSYEPGLLQHLVQHHITPPGFITRRWPYRMLEACHYAIGAEVPQMLHDTVIKESTSPWSSPTEVLAKADRSLSLCNDFVKLN